MRRLQCIFGRADNMVKLRGVNVFPEAVGAVVVEDARSNGEYFCVVDRVGEAGTDEMTVMVEARDTSVDTQALKTDLERRMKEVLGVRVTVEIHGSGALDSYTGTSKTSKVKRLADRTISNRPGARYGSSTPLQRISGEALS